MREQTIQNKIIKLYEAQGYYVLKLSKTNKNGVPDLLCLKSDETPIFIEVKTPNGKVSKIQEYRIKELLEHGFIAFVADKIKTRI